MGKCVMKKEALINHNNFIGGLQSFKNNLPFEHCIIDNFFREDIAILLEKEFLDYTSEDWFCYKNPLEDKKALNDWNKFPPLTYRVLNELNSDSFMLHLQKTLGIKLFSDPGLHGGGYHMHNTNGKLNPHLDYSIHPKLGLQRKLNIIIYLSSELQAEHGGYLGLWEHQPSTNQPGRLIKEIQPQFNRAVLFDTTQNSWHGMSSALLTPSHIYRKSLAVYYLCQPPENVDRRGRALFAAHEGQDSAHIQAIIQKRSNVNHSKEVYRLEDDEA